MLRNFMGNPSPTFPREYFTVYAGVWFRLINLTLSGFSGNKFLKQKFSVHETGFEGVWY